MVSPNEVTAGSCMQGDFPERALLRLNEVCRDATRDVARARECLPVLDCVPVSYPQGRTSAPKQATLHANLQEFYVEAL